MKIAVIPARGGSKRIPRKNIRSFYGKPMIAWSIEAALKSQCFDRVVVSTEDNEIAGVARKHGAETPFMRPCELADDHTGTIPVIRHAISELDQTGIVCCLFATAPLITPLDIRNAFTLMKPEVDFVLSVSEYRSPIQRATYKSETGSLKMLSPDQFFTRSQDLTPAYFDAGQFCIGTTEAWMNFENLFEANVLPYEIESDRAQDIDDEKDWKRAELLAKLLTSAP